MKNAKIGSLLIKDIDKHQYFPSCFTWVRQGLHALESITSIGPERYENKILARVFTNQGTRDDFSDSIIHNARGADECLRTWLNRVTNTPVVCLALNGLNGVSDTLDELATNEFVNDWVDHFPVPFGGFDVYAFIGEYPITPFGIHKDSEHTFLYHLGPGQKHAWVWDPSSLSAPDLKKSGNFDLEIIRSRSSEYVLSAGDALFIPKNHYHVLANPSFCATIGIAPYEITAGSFLASLAEHIVSRQHRASVTLTCEKSGGMFAVSGAAVDRLSSKCLPENFINLLRREMSYEVERRASNNFFKYAPPVISGGLSGSTSVCTGLYKARLVIDDELHIFARGHQFCVSEKYKDDVVRAIEIVNKCFSGTISDLLRLMEPRHPKIAAHLVAQFYRVGLIKESVG